MKSVRAIVFRYLTDAEFFNINKPSGTEPGGGGQKYIDFPITAVSMENWDVFFAGVEGLHETTRAQGAAWTFPIHSIGLANRRNLQNITLFRRRHQSVCVAAQHLYARQANRVLAWHPQQGFPEPQDSTNRHQLPRGLAIYLARTHDNQVWAGWFRNTEGFPSPCRTEAARDLLRAMLRGTQSGAADYMDFGPSVLFIEETDSEQPFSTDAANLRGVVTPRREPQRQAPAGHRVSRSRTPYHRRQRTEAEILNSLFGEDEEYEERGEPPTREITVRTRQRNARAVRDLKELYKNRCQITGGRYVFRKRDGTNYTEAHHLVPLGTGGADDPRNIIIVSPLIHRMLHYADVSEIDLSRIQERADGSAVMTIRINGKPYIITWHRRHAEKVRAHQDGAEES